MIEIMQDSYQRLLSPETRKGVLLEGRTELLGSLVAKLYTKDIMYNADKSAFIDSLVNQFENRWDIALRWLYILSVKNSVK